MSKKLIDLTGLSAYKTSSDAKYQDKLTAGNCIFLNSNVISAGSTYVPQLTSGSQSVASNTDVTISSFTLAPGNYILMYTCQFNSNSSGYRRCSVVVEANPNYEFRDVRPAVNGTLTPTGVLTMFRLSSATMIRLKAWQSSGTTRTAYPRCYYLKY
jgi:hypothetical protein